MLNMPVSLLSNGFLPYLVLGLATMVEGPITLLIGGAAVSSGLLLPVPVYLSVVSGNLIADMAWYALGRFFRKDLFQRLAPKLGVNLELVSRLENNIQCHAPRLLFLTKLTVGFPIPTLVATGLSRVPVRRWGVMLLAGELIKSAAFISAGYLYASAIQQVSNIMQIILCCVTAGLLLTGFVWYKRHNKKRSEF